MQTKSELEDWYENPDPWSYETTPDDRRRKDAILAVLDDYKPFKRALDIGCGEGWITKDLPAKEIHGLELSETAVKRLPLNVKAVDEPEGKYDLIITTGTLYEQYDWRKMLDWVKQHSSRVILVAGIREWLVPAVSELGEPVYTESLKYRLYTQEIKVYLCKK